MANPYSEARERLTGSAPLPGSTDLYAEARQRQARLARANVRPGGSSVWEKYLAASVGQEKLGPGGMVGMKVRADLALSDTFEEKKAKFKRYFPEGDFLRIERPGDVPLHAADPVRENDAIIVRKSKGAPYERLDVPGLADIGGDIADLAGAVPGMAADVALAIGTRGRSLMRSLPRQMIGFGLSGAAGDAARQGVEQLRGLQFESPAEVAQGAAITGTAGAMGTLATAPLAGIANIVRGAGMFTAKPAAEEAVAAGRRQGLPELLPHQVTDNPLLALAGRQASRLAPLVNRKVAEQKSGALGVLAARQDPAALAALPGRLEAAYASSRDKLLQAVRHVPTSIEGGGKALQDGLKDWGRLSRDLVNKKYADARAMGPVELDLTPAKEAAEAISNVKMGLGKPQTVEGKTTQKAINIGAEPSPELQRVIGDIRALDPKVNDLTVGPTMTSAVEQIRALQQRLYDLKTPAFGQQADYSNKLAGDLFTSLEKVLDNPVSGDKAVIAAWKDARRVAKDRFDVLDRLNLTVSALDRNYEPFSLAEALMKPGAHDKIGFVKNTLLSRGLGKRWDTFADAFQTRLLRGESQRPGSLLRELDSFQPETLDLILSKTQQTELRGLGKWLEELQTTGVKETLQKQTQAVAIIEELTAKNNTSAISRMLMIMPPNSPAGKSIRAGLIDRLVTGATVVNKDGAKEINRKTLADGLAALDASGAARWLTATDRQGLHDVEMYLRLVAGPGADAGTSLQAAAAGSSLLKLSGDALMTIIHYVGVGRILTNSFGRRILTASARPKRPFVGLKALGAMLGQLSNEMQKGEKP